MPEFIKRDLKFGGNALLVALGVVAAVAGMVSVRLVFSKPDVEDKPKPTGPVARRVSATQLEIPNGVRDTLGVKTEVVAAGDKDRELPPLSGSLAVINNWLASIRSRFPGEVKEIGKIRLPPDTLDLTPAQALLRKQRASDPTLRNGDDVRKGDLLAVVWSQTLGQAKSTLVAAISQLKLDEKQLEKLADLLAKGATPESSYRTQQQKVEADRIALSLAERSLYTWQLSKDEVEAIKAEAKVVSEMKDRPADPGILENWARVEVRAPIDGRILEQNINLGMNFPDTSAELFKIADLSKLEVRAHAYEEDLPLLRTLKRRLADRGEPLPWKIHLRGEVRTNADARDGVVENIGSLIDPTQHTAFVTGRVDNADGMLTAGQFVTATVMVPPIPDTVVIPTAAVVEDGDASLVFVQADEGSPVYELRRIDVASRYAKFMYVYRTPRNDRANDAGKGLPPLAGLSPGDRVVTSGALEMLSKLRDMPDVTPPAAAKPAR